jgi:FixJ family two-component response regulator
MIVARTPSCEVGALPMSSVTPIVFIVDDDISVRESMELLVRDENWQPKTFASAQEFLDHPRKRVPSCLVLDLSLPGLSGLELQKQLTVEHIDMPIIFITGHGDVPMSVRAMKAGAVEFLTKPFRDQDLLDAIYTSIERDRLTLRRQAELSQLRARYDLLTPREREVMDMVVQGMLNKQIAGQLGTTETTVKIQRRNAMKKMQASSLVGLVRLCEKLQTGDSHHTKV